MGNFFTRDDGFTVSGYSAKLTRESHAKKIFIIAGIVMLALVLVAGAFLLTGHIIYGKTIDHISIVSMPDKVVYYQDEAFDSTGLELMLVGKNGKSESLALEQCAFAGFDTSAVTDSLPIIVKYKDYSVSFSVIVKQTIKPTPSIKAISLETLPKTQYKLGERLDTSEGVILCEYNDGSTFRVSLLNKYVYGFSSITSPGTYTLTVKYKENGIIATTTYTITVTE